MFQQIFSRGSRLSAPRIPQLTPQEVAQQLAGPRPPILIDVRGSDEFTRDGHIQGARLLPLVSLAHRINEVPQDVPVVLVCRSGARSTAASELLVAAGLSNVSNLAGGMQSWQRAGLPLQR